MIAITTITLIITIITSIARWIHPATRCHQIWPAWNSPINGSLQLRKIEVNLGDCPACHDHLSFWHLKAPTGKIWCGLFWCLPQAPVTTYYNNSAEAPPPVDSQEPTNPGRPRRGSRRTVGDLRTCDQ